MTKKKRNYIITAIATIIVVASLVIGTSYYYIFYPQFNKNGASYLYIYPNDNLDSIADKLKGNTNSVTIRAFKLIAKYKDYDKNILTGKYQIETNDNLYHIYTKLSRGHQTPTMLRIKPLQTVGKLIPSLSNQLMIDSAEIAHLLHDSTFLAKIEYTKETLPALFIPNSYEVYWNISAEQLLNRLIRENKSFWSKSRLKKAEALKMTKIEVATLASIVDSETNNNGEKPTIAGLYLNRLRRGIPLQADPTIKYALQEFDLRRITNNYLKVESPYNTYLNKGLPPGPIRIASIKGIESVLNYEKHNYLYMCAKPDFSGTHNFAKSYREHINNAKAYWRELNKRKIY